MTTATLELAKTDTEKTDTEKAVKRRFSKYHKRAEAAFVWWKALQPQQHAGGTTPGDRATLARLRRSGNPAELAVEPATADLFRELKFDATTLYERSIDQDIATAAVLAGVLAHIRKPAKAMRDSLARAMGGKRGDRAVVSAIRMKRFMAAREPEDVLRQYQRILAMLGDAADVRDVAENVLAWLDPSPVGDRARTRFAFAYHGTTLEDAETLDAEATSSTDTDTKA